MWTKNEFITDDNLLYVLGEEYMTEDEYGDYEFPENWEEVLEKVWKEYTRQQWLDRGFYKVRGKLFDLHTQLGELSKEVSKQTLIKVCKEAGLDWNEYRYYL